MVHALGHVPLQQPVTTMLPAPCPEPAKYRYATEEAAAKSALRTWIKYGNRLRHYTCCCGWLHLTSDASIPLPAEVPRPPAFPSTLLDRVITTAQHTWTVHAHATACSCPSDPETCARYPGAWDTDVWAAVLPAILRAVLDAPAAHAA